MFFTDSVDYLIKDIRNFAYLEMNLTEDVFVDDLTALFLAINDVYTSYLKLGYRES